MSTIINCIRNVACVQHVASTEKQGILILYWRKCLNELEWPSLH